MHTLTVSGFVRSLRLLTFLTILFSFAACSKIPGLGSGTGKVDLADLPQVRLTANNVLDEITIDSGETVGLNWNALNVSQCELDGAEVRISGFQVSDPIFVRTEFVVSCEGNNGLQVSSSVVVLISGNVGQSGNPPASPPGSAPSSDPTATLLTNFLDVTELTVPYGGAVTLTWSSAFSSSCTLDGIGVPLNYPGDGVPLNNPGAEFTNLTSTHVFELRCSGNGKTGSDSVNVIVEPPLLPEISLKANNEAGPIDIAYNAAATLKWSTANATSCKLNDQSVGLSNTSYGTGNLKTTKTYTLECTGPGGLNSKSVQVRVPCGNLLATSEASLRDLVADTTVCTIRGGNQTYNLGSSLLINRNLTLKEINLSRSATNYNHMIQIDANDVTLKTMTLTTGSNPNGGAAAHSAIYVSPNHSNITLDGITITGKGRGIGIRVVSSTNVKIKNFHVVNMEATTTGGGNHLTGIYAHNSQTEITNGYVSSLEPNVSVSNGVVDTRTVGILLSNSKDSKIADVEVEKVGMGVRIGGDSNANKNVDIRRVTVQQAATFCYALEYFDGLMTNVHAGSCGRAGVAIESRPGANRLTTIDGITITGIGFNGLFPNTRKAGIYVYARESGVPSPVYITNWSISSSPNINWGNYSEVIHPKIELDDDPAHYSYGGPVGYAIYGFNGQP
ncbi:MAG: hypothetical protein R3B54_10885 [Bdellovibrionota bacterium]